jgi:DNA-binding beta-propeller fold protein YncE
MSAEVSGLGLGLFQSVSIGMSRESRSVQNVDLRDRRRFAPLPLPGVPEAGAASPDGLKFYVALSDTGQVAVVDLRHSAVSHVIKDAVRGASYAVPAVGIGYCH